MKFWRGSGSADLYLILMDPDPAFFVSDLQDVNKKYFFSSKFFYFLKVHLHHFSKIKSHKQKSQNRRSQCFSYYFCLMIEGSGSVSLTKWFRIREAQKHMDPTDPDPQHWKNTEKSLRQMYSLRFFMTSVLRIWPGFRFNGSLDPGW